MSLTRFSDTLGREPSTTHNVLPHANQRTTTLNAKQPDPASYAKLQSLREALLSEMFTNIVTHSVVNYNYAYTFAHLRSCAEALLHKLPQVETTTPNSFPSNQFQCTAIHRRLMRVVLDCREVGREDWRTIIAEEVEECLSELGDLDDDMTLRRSERCERVGPDAESGSNVSDRLVLRLFFAWFSGWLIHLLALLACYVPADIAGEFRLCFRWVIVVSAVFLAIKSASLVISGLVGLFAMMLAAFGVSLF